MYSFFLSVQHLFFRTWWYLDAPKLKALMFAFFIFSLLYIYTFFLWLSKLHQSWSDGTSWNTLTLSNNTGMEIFQIYSSTYCSDRRGTGSMMGSESEACWKKAGPSTKHCTWLWSSRACWSGSEAAFGFAACESSSGDPVGSAAVQAATERSLLLDIQLLNHKGRQGSERGWKIKPADRAYPLCAVNLLSL